MRLEGGNDMKILYRVLFISLFFVLCYNIDILVERVFERTDFFAPRVEDNTQGWWDQIYGAGRSFILEKLGELLEGLIVLASKLFWPFLFAAVAIPFSLPSKINERNKWSMGMSVLLTIISVIVIVYIKNDMAALWQSIKSLRFSDLSMLSGIVTKVKWAMVLFAINLTVLYTFLYRVLHSIKMEQLLYFIVLITNAFYIVMLDPVPGEVDDVLGVVVTAFLSLALLFDRLMVKDDDVQT